MPLFKNNWTKWIHFGNFGFSDSDYIVFVRGNTKTGMMEFKTVKANPVRFGLHNRFLPHNLIDVRKQWEKILELMGTNLIDDNEMDK